MSNTKQLVKAVNENQLYQMRDDEIDHESIASESDDENIDDLNALTSISKKPNLIEFPLMQQYERPLGRTFSIPDDYKFGNLHTYVETMTRLERENYFRQFRTSLQANVINEQDYFDDGNTSTRNEYQLITNYVIDKIGFEYIGFVLDITIYMRIPKYQQELWKVKSNQLMIFVNKESKKIYAGKSVVQQEVPTEEFAKFKGDFCDKDAFQNGDQDNRYKGEEDEDLEDPFEIIDFLQNFQIKMDVLPNFDEFLFDLNHIQDSYYLISPHSYWNALQQSLNCIQQFRLIKGISFPDQTLHGKKGSSTFPKYEFLQTDQEIDYFKGMVEDQVKTVKELDEFQKQALRHALFNENAVIQGPPGTGKTFLACKIVSIMHEFHQQHVRKPILVLSKKNLSLDQLLVKIKNCIPKAKMLRIGTRTTHPEMKLLTIQEQGGPTKIGKSSHIKHQDINKQLKNYQKQLKLRRNQRETFDEEELKLSKNLQNIIKERLIFHLKSSINLTDENVISDDIQEKIFEKWLNGRITTALKLKNLLKQTKIMLSDEQEQLIKQMLYIQQQNLECHIEKEEKVVIAYVNEFTCFSDFSFGFSQFLLNKQAFIEINIILNQMRQYEKSIRRIKYEVEEDYQDELGTFMSGYDVIGMTFTGYHMHFQALQKVEAEIVVIEEASEIIESEFFPILTPNLKHLIQIGDHQQLRPMIKSHSLQYKYNYKMSYFERLITVNQVELVTLYKQRRMLPQFANFTRLFYGSKYIDDQSTFKRDFVKPISDNGMYMHQHTFPDQRMADSSYTNLYEALFVKNIASFLVKKYKYLPDKISIITMYKSQKILIQNQIKRIKQVRDIEVHTIDQFQGNENDIIILSCVRSNSEFQSGFVLNDHRINVAFSRARRGFFCIGNFEMLSEASQTWKKITELCNKNFSYGGLIPKPFYKIVHSITKDQLEKEQRYDYEDLNQCNLCVGESHIGCCSARNPKRERKAPNLIVDMKKAVKEYIQQAQVHIPMLNVYQQIQNESKQQENPEKQSLNTQIKLKKPLKLNGSYQNTQNNNVQPQIQPPLNQKEEKVNYQQQFYNNQNDYDGENESDDEEQKQNSQEEYDEESNAVYEEDNQGPSISEAFNVQMGVSNIQMNSLPANPEANLMFQKQFIKSEGKVSLDQWHADGKANLQILEYNNSVKHVFDNFTVNQKLTKSQKKKLQKQQQEQLTNNKKK